MSQNRKKIFIENFLFYGLLTVLSKAIPLVMLPIVTRLLPDTADYGIADMFNVISNFGTQIALLGMNDAMFREFFEYKNNFEYQKKITSTAFVFVLLCSVLIFLIFIIGNSFISQIFFNSNDYRLLSIIAGLYIFFAATRVIVQAPTRMRNRRKVFLFTGICMPLVNYGLIIIFINIGLTYEALIYANVINVIIFCLVFYFLNHNDFKFDYFDKTILKELLKIGVPLLPTFIIYWVFGSLDRIMISKILSNSELGIYSVGAKIASVSLLIYTAFSSSWQFFAFSTMKDKDQVNLNSKVFEYLGIISISAFIISLPFINPVFNFIFSGDYIRGNVVFPYLFLSPLFLMLFQTLSSQFLVIKKSYLISLCLGIGGVINVILNYFFINSFGIKGAAFATLISYSASILCALIIAKYYKMQNVKKRFYYISFIFSLLITAVFLEYSTIKYILYCFIVLLICICYRKEVLYGFKSIVGKFI